MLSRKAFFSLSVAFLLLAPALAHADLFHSPKFKSPTGKYEVIFASANAALPFNRTSDHIPTGQKVQYILLFYVVGSSDPVSADWYTDSDPAPSPEQIMASMLWSPGEKHVVVSHGLGAKMAGISRWLISLTNPAGYGFEGDHLQWIDDNRLIADLMTKKVPGGIELVDASRHHGELIISPHAGLGYRLAAVKSPSVTVQNFLNHWGDEQDKTTWESFEPACFDLNLDSLKKKTVPCPALKP
jgi:hypothetical protein